MGGPVTDYTLGTGGFKLCSKCAITSWMDDFADVMTKENLEEWTANSRKNYFYYFPGVQLKMFAHNNSN